MNELAKQFTEEANPTRIQSLRQRHVWLAILLNPVS